MKIRLLPTGMVFMLIALGVSAQMPSSVSISSCPSGSVDMCIYNGVSGQLVPDNEEETKGAVTVANLNDTDGDDYPDAKESFIGPLFGGQGLAEDIDMMKLVLHPVINAGANKKVKLILVKTGGIGIKLWRSIDKSGGEVLFKSNIAEFLPSQLPLTLYIEALSYSVETRDIELKMEYNGAFDVVKATALWVVNSRIWCVRNTCSPSCADNPIAGLDRLVGIPDGIILEKTINENRVSVDGSRFGHGYDSKVSGADKGFGGRILFEFLIYPTNENLANLGVRFDCGRQRKLRIMRVIHGAIPGNPTYMEDFPFEIGENIDKANDDSDNDDEYNVPTLTSSFDGYPAGYRFYSWDRPGITDIHEGQVTQNDIGTSFKVGRQLFKEFARVKIAEDFPNGDDEGNNLLGSRASDKIDWYSVYYTKSGVGNLLEPDNQTVSISNPKRIGNSGGSCSAVLLSNATNAGYKLSYTFSSKQWQLKSANGNVIASAFPDPGSNPKKWNLTDPSKVQVTIIENSSNPFNNDSKFNFSVFKSLHGKINVTVNSPFSNIILDDEF